MYCDCQDTDYVLFSVIFNITKTGSCICHDMRLLILTVVFKVIQGYPVPHSSKRNFRVIIKVYLDQLPFLSPNQQC